LSASGQRGEAGAGRSCLPWKIFIKNSRIKTSHFSQWTLVKKKKLFNGLFTTRDFLSGSYWRSHPMKFLIDKKGNVAGIAQGYREWDKEEMKSLIKLLMIS
jgi:hypothetical protein